MTQQTAKDTLEEMKGNPYWIDGRQETIQSYNINMGTEKVVIVTDCTERRVSLLSLGQHLKLYRKNPPTDVDIKEESAGLKLIESLPQNANMQFMEEALIEQVQKLKAGEKEAIPIAETMNRVATTFLNMQKNKIEMGKLIVEVHKNAKK